MDYGYYRTLLCSRTLIGNPVLEVNPGMLTRPAGHEAKAEAQNFFSRPRPDKLDNNSVCIGMKTKILAFRTQFSVSNQYTTEMIVDGYILNIN